MPDDGSLAAMIAPLLEIVGSFFLDFIASLFSRDKKRRKRRHDRR